MDFMKWRIKMLENFKDGNILEGRALKAGEVLEVTESEKNQIWQSSGGMIEVLGQIIPNPRKHVEDTQPVEAEPVVVVKEDKRRGPKAKNARS